MFLLDTVRNETVVDQDAEHFCAYQIQIINPTAL